MPDDSMGEKVRDWLAEIDRLSQLPEAGDIAAVARSMLATLDSMTDRTPLRDAGTGTLFLHVFLPKDQELHEPDVQALIDDLIAYTARTTDRLPVPTEQELLETEQVLRERVLPEVSEEELRRAVEEVPDDPEKTKLAAFLINVMQRALSVSPTPYAVFVVVFWIAMRMNASEAAAAALAFIVMQDYRNRHGG